MQEALRDRKDAVAEASWTLEIVIDEEKATVEALKDAYRQSGEAQLRELVPEIYLLVAKGAQANADAKVEELRKATEEVWADLEVRMDDAVGGLQDAVTVAASRFQ